MLFIFMSIPPLKISERIKTVRLIDTFLLTFFPFLEIEESNCYYDYWVATKVVKFQDRGFEVGCAHIFNIVNIHNSLTVSSFLHQSSL